MSINKAKSPFQKLYKLVFFGFFWIYLVFFISKITEKQTKNKHNQVFIKTNDIIIAKHKMESLLIRQNLYTKTMTIKFMKISCLLIRQNIYTKTTTIKFMKS